MKTRVLVFCALLAGLAGTAQATTTVNTKKWSEVVSYADLDIAKDADAAILLQRVKDAARRVCIRSGALLALDFFEPMQRCVSDATTRALADVNGKDSVASVSL